MPPRRALEPGSLPTFRLRRGIFTHDSERSRLTRDVARTEEGLFPSPFLRVGRLCVCCERRA